VPIEEEEEGLAVKTMCFAAVCLYMGAKNEGRKSPFIQFVLYK
jgi:hypothetical protein